MSYRFSAFQHRKNLKNSSSEESKPNEKDGEEEKVEDEGDGGGRHHDDDDDDDDDDDGGSWKHMVVHYPPECSSCCKQFAANNNNNNNMAPPPLPPWNRRIGQSHLPVPNGLEPPDSLDSDGSGGGGSSTSGNEQLPTWKTYLYQLQKEAPHPRRIICQRDIPNKPHYYGKEYHANISRDEVDRIMGDSDGAYLVRKSERAPDAFTLAIKFDGQTKNFKLYYDGQHYVGEKRFDTVHDLVADGLITFYLESRAPDYIESMSISNYAESPYLAYSTKKKRLQRSTTRSTNNQNKQGLDNTSTENNTADEQNSDDPDDIPANVQEYEKAHCFKVQNFIGLHWCDFCANFMWGLIAQGVKCQDCGFEAHKKCSERVPNDCMPDMKYVKRLFGADLTTVVKAQNTPIPVVVEKCIKEIEQRGVDFEGMYRVAGFHDDIEMVRMAFDRDGENTDLSEDKWEDINILTSVLKLYFRLLPIPLVSFESYPKLLEAVQKPGLKEKEKLVLIKEALHLLQPAHYQTLKYLMGHLGRVVEQQSKNMMSSENLAIVFAPTLMRSPDATASLMAVKLEQTVTELIVSHQRDLFSR